MLVLSCPLLTKSPCLCDFMRTRKKEGGIPEMKIKYVVSNRKTAFQYRGQLFGNVQPFDGAEDHGVPALEIYEFEGNDPMNYITGYQVKSTHRVTDCVYGLPFDVIVLVNDSLEVKRDLIFRDGKLYLSGIYGINIDHIKDEYEFVNAERII